MLRFLTTLLEEQVEYSVKRAISPLAPYLQKLASGLLFFVLAAVTFSAALLFFALGMFFLLAESLNSYAQPALLVSLGATLVALVFVGAGASRFKRPR